MTDSWRQIPIVCPGHSRPLAELQYSPATPDGVFLISGCLDKMPMLRRGENGDWVGTFEGHKGAVWSAQLNSSATQAATGSADFTAKLWDAITGDELHTFSHKHIVKSVAFSPDDKKLATGGHDKILRVFDLGSLSAVNELNAQEVIRKVVFADENTLISGGSTEGSIKVWDLRTNDTVHEFKLTAGVMDLEVSQDRGILTAAGGSYVHFFDISKGYTEMYKYKMPINFLEEGGASLHPSKQKFIAGGSDLWVRVFDFETGKELECHKGHHGPVRCLRYSPGGESFATGSEDGTIRIWQTEARIENTGVPVVSGPLEASRVGEAVES